MDSRFKKIGKILFFIVTGMVVVGCESTVEKKVEVSAESLNPDRKPVYNKTYIDDAVRCMDRRIEMRGDKVQKVRLYIDPDIADLADAGVNSTRDMLLTALMKLGATNNKIIPVHYASGTDLENVSRGLDAGRFNNGFQMPEYFLRGSITQAQKGHSTGGKSSSFGIGIGNISAEKKDKQKVKVSSVGLDLHLGRIGSMEMIPGMYSSNILSVEEKGDSSSMYASIVKADFDYGLDFTQKEGMGAAVRALVELGAMELVTKLFGIDEDYRQCTDPKTRAAATEANTGTWWNSDAQIELFSDRGVEPLYDHGELQQFMVSTSKDMHLYCFYSQGNDVLRLFPNRYVKSAYRKADQVLEIPSADIPVQLIMSMPPLPDGRPSLATTDQFSCYGTDKNITSRLADVLNDDDGFQMLQWQRFGGVTGKRGVEMNIQELTGVDEWVKAEMKVRGQFVIPPPPAAPPAVAEPVEKKQVPQG